METFCRALLILSLPDAHGQFQLDKVCAVFVGDKCEEDAQVMKSKLCVCCAWFGSSHTDPGIITSQLDFWQQQQGLVCPEYDSSFRMILLLLSVWCFQTSGHEAGTAAAADV